MLINYPKTRNFSGILVTSLLLTALLLLSGCETTSTRITTNKAPADWSEREKAILAFSQWSLQGKLAVTQGKHSDSLLINQWRQDEASFDIHVSSALLGLGATRIEGSPNYIGLHQPDEDSLYSTTPELLLQQTLGWTLPLKSLAYWVKGMPAPNQPAELEFDTVGLPYHLTQSDWQIELEHYQPVENMMLPHKITMSRRDIRLRMVITDWQAYQ